MTPTPQCQFVEVDWAGLEEQIESKIRVLDRFHEWARYFGIKTCLTQVKREMKRLYREGLMPVQAYSVWREE